ncbi:MAG: hypothetical protein HRU09_19855 [Oligoflexales bacterium]|nr:hypothetical protein [Oligoflexales bacterium]
MKIYEIQLKNPEGKTMYKSLVPEVHVQEKVDTLIRMNEIAEIGAILMRDVG